MNLPRRARRRISRPRISREDLFLQRFRLGALSLQVVTGGEPAQGFLGNRIDRESFSDCLNRLIDALIQDEQIGVGAVSGNETGIDFERLLHVAGHGIDEVHGVPEPDEPAGIDTGGAADVEDVGRRRRQVAAEQRFRAQPLEAAVRLLQARAFVGGAVVLEDVRVDAGHARTLGRRSPRPQRVPRGQPETMTGGSGKPFASHMAR